LKNKWEEEEEEEDFKQALPMSEVVSWCILEAHVSDVQAWPLKLSCTR
jgi:hypothetical protein